jgi:hypothetical protein
MSCGRNFEMFSNQVQVLMAQPSEQISQWHSHLRADGQITIEYKLNTAEKGRLLINDIYGNIVASYNLNTETSRMTTILPKMAIGIYTYKLIIDEQQKFIGKLVVH